ncbi:hypothetical protein GCM10027214_31590 [Stenotrophomonas tumulicola]
MEHLSQMLPPWLAKARHDAQFWPHFTVLAGELLADTAGAETAHAVRRIEAMLTANGKDPAVWYRACAKRNHRHPGLPPLPGPWRAR